MTVLQIGMPIIRWNFLLLSSLTTDGFVTLLCLRKRWYVVAIGNSPPEPLFIQAPLFVLALLTGLQALALFALFLLAYRWLAVRWPRLALLAYGLLVLLVIAGTLVGDQSFLRSGMYVFQGGYTIETDVVYGVVIFCLPLVLYHIIRQRQRVASAKISSIMEDSELKHHR
jgi:hypothetical protein